VSKEAETLPGIKKLLGQLWARSTPFLKSAVGSVSDGVVAVQSSSKIGFTVPVGSSSEAPTSINFGFAGKDGSTAVDFRLQSSKTADGKDATMIVASAPMMVNSVQYAEDARIKKNVASVDEDALLQRIQDIRIRTSTVTDVWADVNNQVQKQVRGVIAQELAEVFPEHVTVVPEYTTADSKISLQNFMQVDKTALLMDVIAAMQSHSRKFAVEPNSAEQSGGITVSTAHWTDVFDATERLSSGDVTVTTGDAEKGTSGSVLLQTGSSAQGAAGGIKLAVGQSGSGDGASIAVIGGATADKAAQGGDVIVSSGAGGIRSGNVVISSAANSLGTGSIVMTTGSSESGAAGAISVAGGASQEGKGAAVSVHAGDSMRSVGGDLSVTSGAGTEGGALSLRSGDASAGSGGTISILAGEGKNGGGSVQINAGSSEGAVGDRQSVV
jgi:hypothetical protein